MLEIHNNHNVLDSGKAEELENHIGLLLGSYCMVQVRLHRYKGQETRDSLAELHMDIHKKELEECRDYNEAGIDCSVD